MKTKLLKLIAVVSIVVFFVGCETELLKEKPQHIITAETLYKSLAGFETGLNGAYSLIRREHNGSIDFTSNMFTNGTDNLCPNWGSGFSQVAIYWSTVSNPSNSNYERVFAWLYGIVNATNTIINKAEASTGID